VLVCVERWLSLNRRSRSRPGAQCLLPTWNFRENLRAAAERAERTMQHGKMTGENMR
jgi:hypothetical protein